MAKLKNLKGKQFGYWTVIERASDHITPSGNKFVRWLCECKCGEIESVWASNLSRGASTKCKKCVYIIEDLTDKKFGRLTIVERKDIVNKKTGKKAIAWICRCDCGNESWVRSAALTAKKPIVSCGCRQKEVIKERTKEDRISHLISIIYKDYKVNARKRNLSFDLTIKEFKELIGKPCRYCGEIHSNEKKDIAWKTKESYAISDTALKYNGIDRLDSSLGYKSFNCVPCCSVCNKMKSDYPFEVFLNHIKKIIDKWEGVLDNVIAECSIHGSQA